MSADAVIAALARGERIAGRVVLVVAHPDDETVGMGSRLAAFDDLLLVHVTDGAPTDPAWSRAAGFPSQAAYAAARRVELDAALAALGAAPERVALGLADQGAHADLPALIERLRGLLAGCAAVITHAYEHGHPDHDTCALAVARAAPEGAGRIEFATYFRDGDDIRFGSFFPHMGAAETRLALSAGQLAAKRAAMAAHASQAGTLAEFDPGRETLRPAPEYDFTRAAPPGEAVYEMWSFPLSAADWRAAVAATAR